MAAVPQPPRPGTGELAEERFHQRRWRKHKWMALVLGALIGGLAGWANSTIGLAIGLPFALIDPGLVMVVVAVFVAPVVEEHVKLFVLVLVRQEERATYTPRRWMVLGILAGVGFGLAEALLYWQLLLPISFEVANLHLFTRLLLTVPLHGLTVAATGYGYGRYRHEGRSGPLVWGLAVAILAHAAFNAYQTLPSLGVGS